MDVLDTNEFGAILSFKNGISEPLIHEPLRAEVEPQIEEEKKGQPELHEKMLKLSVSISRKFWLPEVNPVDPQ